ncbi:2-oxo acid dehydrogenase subunit E2 [Roseibium sp. CAU 1637]|uniref:Dihydrolipoyllysine-residue acetyltransferase component of pyruvate dehydrogenase complex n=1 Tax=Roseibium limicola TaxID=2816037 RepID=A0A939JBF9_9HYPH|nr:2-oxo acid dehydrogenase subunit E2 [Roseibium limicola]MBO0347423.1 2-oxo acid dehydrogenase subunit E2 [Roseibium limicola]
MTDVIAPPSVRALARQKGIDIEQLARDIGRKSIAREDVIAGGNKPAPASGDRSYWEVDHSLYGEITSESISRFARVAARNMAAAHSLIPAVTHHDRADMSAVEAFRKELKTEARQRGVKLTALAFHVRGLARVLREFPRFNASLSADCETLFLKDYVHIGIAVDTAQGLIVPVIRDADKKGLWQLAGEISDLASRAQERKVRPDEMGGASMSITNLGGIGGTAFTPIVNPPEVAILGITRAEMQPVWDGGAFQPVLMAPLDLSYDHRVINGADAARFLSTYAGFLADPRRMMI